MDHNSDQNNSKNTVGRIALCILRPHKNQPKPIGKLKDEMPF